jgi:hypothetical protein
MIATDEFWVTSEYDRLYQKYCKLGVAGLYRDQDNVTNEPDNTNITNEEGQPIAEPRMRKTPSFVEFTSDVSTIDVIYKVKGIDDDDFHTSSSIHVTNKRRGNGTLDEKENSFAKEKERHNEALKRLLNEPEMINKLHSGQQIVEALKRLGRFYIMEEDGLPKNDRWENYITKRGEKANYSSRITTELKRLYEKNVPSLTRCKKGRSVSYGICKR